MTGSAEAIGEDILMAPGPDGSLFVSIPSGTDTVLARYDRQGKVRPGWPVVLDEPSPCGVLLPVSDGSVRVVCNARELAPGAGAAARAFAFGADGTALPGWPVDLGPTNQLDELAASEGRMMGDRLVLSSYVYPSAYEVARVITIEADGTIDLGASIPLSNGCCPIWAVGPDGHAYGLSRPTSERDWADGSSRLTSLDLGGRRPGWPASVGGIASGPAFGSEDRILVAVGTGDAEQTRVVAFDGTGADSAMSSPVLPFITAASSLDCPPVLPVPPVVAEDGTAFVVGGVEAQVYALDASLEVRSGWPFEMDKRLASIGYDDPLFSQFCPSFALPAVDANGTIYLPINARNGSVGGSLVAIGGSGHVRTGWPVELRKPGATFWSVVVGPDGVIHALVIEPEANGGSSATILGIGPDSTVVTNTTIVAP